jgi:hypothetical protein
VPGLEREFTLGPTAHNYPVIGDSGVQVERRVKILNAVFSEGEWYSALNITGSYDRSAGVRRVVRQIWLTGDSLVVVADLVEFSGKPQPVNYHWHANPEAALWLEDGSCLVSVDNMRLWVTCADNPLDEDQVRRLPGTRGQITIGREIEPTGKTMCVWWLFKRGQAPAEYALTTDGRSIETGGMSWSINSVLENK